MTTEQRALALSLADRCLRVANDLFDSDDYDSAEAVRDSAITLSAQHCELAELRPQVADLTLSLEASERRVENHTSLIKGYQAELAAAKAQVEALSKDAARWHWLSDHMQVHWSEGKFTSLVRIVSEEWRAAINASLDRMMAGDWSDADAPPKPLTRPAVPDEGSAEASQAIQAMLAEYDFPSNPTNAARAGWRACRLLATAPQPD